MTHNRRLLRGTSLACRPQGSGASYFTFPGANGKTRTEATPLDMSAGLQRSFQFSGKRSCSEKGISSIFPDLKLSAKRLAGGEFQRLLWRGSLFRLFLRQ